MRCPLLSDLPSPPEGKSGWPWKAGSGPVEGEKASDGTTLPKISVVTPSFNQAPFLEETIRSVLLQGYPDLEYMVMDGGSTDRSPEIIRKYGPWLSHWVSEADRGQSHAINKGWSMARGDILGWVNSDDIYYPNALERVARFFKAHPGVDMVYGDCRVIDENGAVKGQSPTMAFDLEALICNQWFIPQTSTFIRRQVLDSIGLVNEELHLVMDWEYWVRVALNGFTIEHFPSTLGGYRQYANAKTFSLSERSGEEKIRVLDAFFDHGGPRFPVNIERFKKKAYGYVYTWAGSANSRNRHPEKALVNFLKAMRYEPELAADRRHLRRILSSLVVISKKRLGFSGRLNLLRSGASDNKTPGTPPSRKPPVEE